MAFQSRGFYLGGYTCPRKRKDPRSTFFVFFRGHGLKPKKRPDRVLSAARPRSLACDRRRLRKAPKRSLISVRDVFPVRAFSQPGGVSREKDDAVEIRVAKRRRVGRAARSERRREGPARVASGPRVARVPGSARRAARARGRATASFASSSFLFRGARGSRRSWHSDARVS